jgi:hypothetical protein
LNQRAKVCCSLEQPSAMSTITFLALAAARTGAAPTIAIANTASNPAASHR